MGCGKVCSVIIGWGEIVFDINSLWENVIVNCGVGQIVFSNNRVGVFVFSNNGMMEIVFSNNGM